MPSASSLRINNLVLKLFGLCYVSGIVSLSLYLSPCLDMVLLEFPFTSYIEKCGQESREILARFRLLIGTDVSFDNCGLAFIQSSARCSV